MKKTIVALLAVFMIGMPCRNNLFLTGANAAKDPLPEAAKTEAPKEKSAETPDPVYLQRKEDTVAAKKLIIARVNGAEISMFSLVGAMNKIAPKYLKAGEEISPEITGKIKKEALDLLIFEELAVQEAQRQKIIIDDQKIQEVVNNVKKGLETEEAYQKYLESRDLTEEKLKELIKRGRQRESVMGREIYNKVKVDPAKIKEEYEKMKAEGSLKRKENFQVKEVYMLKGKDEANTRKRAEELLAEVKANKNEFGPLVQDGTFIVRTVNVSEEKTPEVYKAMMKMEIGELSGIIKDKDTFHIIKVDKKEPARDSTIEEATDYIENRLRLPAQEQREKTWKEELLKKAEVKILLDEVEKKLQEEKEKKDKEEAAKKKSE